MPNEVNNFTQAVLADLDVVTARTGQFVAHQNRDSVAVDALVGRGGEQVLEFVEALAIDLQSKRLHQFGEPLVDVVGAAGVVDLPALSLGDCAAPRVALPRAEHERIIGTLGENELQRLNRFGPQRDDVRRACLASLVGDLGTGHVDHVTGQLGRLCGPIAAVECEQGHGLHLLPRMATAAIAGGELGIQSGENVPHLLGREQFPLHLAFGANGQLADELSAKPNVSAPARIFGVAATHSQVLHGAGGSVGLVARADCGVERLDVIGAELGDGYMPHLGVDALRASLVLRIGGGLDCPPLCVSTAILHPTREDVMQGDDALDGFGLVNGLAAGDQGGGFSVVDGQCFVGAPLTADPSGLSSNACDVSTFCDGKCEIPRQNRRPIGPHALAIPVRREPLIGVSNSGTQESKQDPRRGEGRAEPAAAAGDEFVKITAKTGTNCASHETERQIDGTTGSSGKSKDSRAGRSAPNGVFTYFVKAERIARIKIGRCRNLDKRLRTLRSSSPVRLHLLGVLDGDREREMHHRFAMDRRNGEWFRVTKQLLAFIKENTRLVPVKPPRKTWRELTLGRCGAAWEAARRAGGAA